MNKVYAALAVTLLAVTLVTGVSQREYKASTDGSTVLINLLDEKGEVQSLGSGVDIGNGVVVTARHVVHDQKNIQVENDKGEKTSATLMFEDEAHDIAVIQLGVVNFDRRSSFLRCDYAPTIGDEIEVVGNPMGVKFVHTWGRVATGLQSDEKIIKTWADVYVADISIAPGNSGGPVFDSHGRVVGIAVGILLAPLSMMSATATGLSFIVPSSTVCGLIKKHEEAVS